MSTEEREYRHWRDRIQGYLDGTLSRKESVRLFLYAERHPKLKAELEEYRTLLSLLDAAPREQPSADFDAAVLRSVPYQRYRTLPRRAERVLIIGDPRPSLARRAVGRMGRGASAVALAYVLFLAISHSVLQVAASRAAFALQAWLDGLAAHTASTPVLSGLVHGLARVYDAAIALFSALGHWLGGGLLTFLVGLAVGGVLLALTTGVRRRHEAGRSEA